MSASADGERVDAAALLKIQREVDQSV